MYFCIVNQGERHKKKLKKIENMKNEIKNQLTEVIENNLVEYFANSISSSRFIDEFIRPITSVTEDQEEEIANIMAEANRDWDNAECDVEGATREQDILMDKILEKTASCIIAQL